MVRPWNILVVDDDPDVHHVTKLALRRRAWRDRPFDITTAASAQEARVALENYGPDFFHVAMVDVVMESEHAGLELCRYLRRHSPISLRIILRTGQPGSAPEERVMNDYDIDHYLPKTEATPDRIYAQTRSCLRVSQEISTVLELTSDLKNFAQILSHVESVEAFFQPIDDSLRFVEGKYGVIIGLILARYEGTKLVIHAHNNRVGIDPIASLEIFDSTWSDSLPMVLHPRQGPASGGVCEAFMVVPLLTPNVFSSRNAAVESHLHEDFLTWLGTVILPNPGWEEMLQDVLPSTNWERIACLHVLMETPGKPKAVLASLEKDLNLFAETWKVAYSAYCMQKNITYLREMIECTKIS